MGNLLVIKKSQESKIKQQQSVFNLCDQQQVNTQCCIYCNIIKYHNIPQPMSRYGSSADEDHVSCYKTVNNPLKNQTFQQSQKYLKMQLAVFAQSFDHMSFLSGVVHFGIIIKQGIFQLLVWKSVLVGWFHHSCCFFFSHPKTATLWEM